MEMIACAHCGAQIDTSKEEPLARVTCPACGEKTRVTRSFDHFELLETLGLGGMGKVYKARDLQLAREVALKLLRPDLGPEYAKQLQQEARVTASINHPNVVQVFSFGKAHDQYYLVMELVDRGTLDDLIEEKKKLPEADVLRAGIEVAKGLRAAHEKGLIHRDVKPANILFAADGSAKMSDFGLARIVEPVAQSTGAIWGTPYYVAPERLKSEPEDFRSDIFSPGATLFHALAGCPPFEGETTSAADLLALKNNPLQLNKVAPEVSALTASTISRMIAPDPPLRFSSYDETIAALEKARRRLLGEHESGGGKWWAIAAMIALAAAGAFYFLHHKLSPKVAPAAPAKSAADYSASFAEARGMMRDGNFTKARAAFAKLATNARNVQPIYSWARLHQSLTALLDNENTLAQQAAQEVENAGTRGFADAALGQALLEMGKLASQRSAVARTELPAGPVRSFALFFFGISNMQLGRFSEAAELLDAYIKASPASPAWINDDKSLAQKYLADCRQILAWRDMIASAKTPAEVRAALAKLREGTPNLQRKTMVTLEAARDEKELVRHLSASESAERTAAERKQQELLARETPLWQNALAEFHRAVASYDFVAAAEAIRRAPVTALALKEQQEFYKRVANWLVEWKADLVQQLNAHGYKGSVADGTALPATGIGKADGSNLEIKNPYGSAPKPWTAIQPASQFVVISTSFAQNPDHIWRCGVFAWVIGSANDAKKLFDQAAAAKPAYREQRPRFDQPQ